MTRMREEVGKRGSKEWWKLFNEEMGNKFREDCEPKATPDEINKAFIKKIEKLRGKVENKTKWKAKGVTGRKRFQGFQTVTTKTVKAAIKQSNNTKSGGVDEIP